MDRQNHVSAAEAMAMLDAPLNISDLPDGDVRVERAGIVGVGATLADAARDWASKFTIVFTRPQT